jgi:hypothetical protein
VAPPAFFVDPSRYERDASVAQVGIVAVADRDEGREGAAVMHVGRHCLGTGAIAVDQHDVAHPGARGRRHGHRRPDRADANDAQLHWVSFRSQGRGGTAMRLSRSFCSSTGIAGAGLPS